MSNVGLRGRKKNGKARTSNESGLVGAMKAGGYGKYKSEITIKGRRIYLGYFHSEQDAHDAYVEAAVKNGIDLA